METGDVVFVRGTSFISRLVRFFDKGRFSHVAIAISTDRIEEAQYNTRVRSTPLTYENYEVVEMNLTEEQKRHLLASIPKYKGKYYDFLLALSFATKWLRIDMSNYVLCTELVMDLLKDVGALDERLEDMKPNELYDYLVNVRKGN